MEHSYRLIVSSNRKYSLIHTPETVYVEAGRKIRLKNPGRYADADNKFLDSLPFGDDSGDNISQRNPEWNELTVIYWAFRNYESLGSPDYIGFEQYRRHFIFDEWKKVSERALCFPFDEVNEDYEKALRQDRENVERYLSKYDLIYPKYPMRCSVYEQYRREAANGHHIEDLDLIVSIIPELFPAYKGYADKYLSGRMNFFCNMFVMKKELFFEYCNFIFPVLFEFEKRRNSADRSFAEKRLFVSERLTGIFITRLISEGYRCCPVPVALVSHKEMAEKVSAAAPSGTESAAVIEDCGSGAAAIAACLASIGESSKLSKGDHVPDVLVLSDCLSPAERKLLSNTAGSYGLSLRFPEISPGNAAPLCFRPGWKGGDSGAAHAWLSPGMLGLCLLPELRNYRKVAVVDSRCVITGDLGELLQSAAASCLAAVPASLRFYLASKAAALASGKPHKVLEESADFFSAPLVILNTGKAIAYGAVELVRKAFAGCGGKGSTDETWLEKAKAEFREKFLTQTDVLPCAWDIEPELIYENMGHKLLTEDAARQIEEAQKSPKLLDFSRSGAKPWIRAVYEEDLIWWEFFRKCPGSDVLLQNVSHAQAPADPHCVKGREDRESASPKAASSRLSAFLGKAFPRLFR